ncbi:hypothetical protein ACFL1Q_01295 [Patescibacteria group bacterium]
MLSEHKGCYNPGVPPKDWTHNHSKSVLIVRGNKPPSEVCNRFDEVVVLESSGISETDEIQAIEETTIR